MSDSTPSSDSTSPSTASPATDSILIAEPAADVLDGNAAAGVLRTIFAVELTAAVGTCEGCGQRAVMAEARLFTQAPGLVARCRGCDGILLRVVTSPDCTWLDLRGLRSIEIGSS